MVPVDPGTFSPRPHPQSVVNLQLVDRNFVVGPVVADAPRGFRREAPNSALIAPEVASRARNSEHLAEQHERHRDDGGGLEIGCNRAAMTPEGRGKSCGATVVVTPL